MDLIVNPYISYLICSNYLSTCWSIQLISYYVNRDCVFFIFPVIILDNKQKGGCEKTRLSFFTAPFYIKYFFLIYINLPLLALHFLTHNLTSLSAKSNSVSNDILSSILTQRFIIPAVSDLFHCPIAGIIKSAYCI